MRRRTKPRVVWLPVTNVNSIDALNRSTIQNFGILVNTNVAGTTASTEVPVIVDGVQSSPLDDTSSLSDIENSGYRLRRIVGDIWVEALPTNAIGKAQIIVTCGFIIRRTSSETGISFAAAGGAANIALDDIENGMDPWIWRRSWLLGFEDTTAVGLAPTLGGIRRAPPNNFGQFAGGLHSGSHVDQKTARIVGPEERLMLDTTVTVQLNGTAGADDLVIVTSNLRVLASMRTSSGNRRNASR